MMLPGDGLTTVVAKRCHGPRASSTAVAVNSLRVEPGSIGVAAPERKSTSPPSMSTTAPVTLPSRVAGTAAIRRASAASSGSGPGEAASAGPMTPATGRADAVTGVGEGEEEEIVVAGFGAVTSGAPSGWTASRMTVEATRPAITVSVATGQDSQPGALRRLTRPLDLPIVFSQ